MADPEGSRVSWELVYTGLTDAEMSALEELFQQCEGRLTLFEFADPCSNLLRWTEDLEHEVWQTALRVTKGVADPYGGTGAASLTNAAQAAQGFGQTVDAPSSYTYTFSVWVRSASVGQVEIDVAGRSAIRQVSADWQCIAVTAPADASDGQFMCSVQVPGGNSIDVYGLQVEAQADASGYKRNDGQAGVCLARFDQDELEQISYGLDNHATRIRVLKVQER
jgi:hypothetical protein